MAEKAEEKVDVKETLEKGAEDAHKNVKDDDSQNSVESDKNDETDTNENLCEDSDVKAESVETHSQVGELETACDVVDSKKNEAVETCCEKNEENKARNEPKEVLVHATAVFDSSPVEALAQTDANFIEKLIFREKH